MLEGKQVAAEDKVLSLFEPHTRVIPRHKGGVPVEFGRQVELDEIAGCATRLPDAPARSCRRGTIPAIARPL
jgi:hypothetical protein